MTVDGPEGEAALLQLRLGVVPLLVDDELLQPREEANFGENAAEFLEKKSTTSFTGGQSSNQRRELPSTEKTFLLPNQEPLVRIPAPPRLFIFPA